MDKVDDVTFLEGAMASLFDLDIHDLLVILAHDTGPATARSAQGQMCQHRCDETCRSEQLSA